MRVLIADDDLVSRIAVEELFAERGDVQRVSVDSGAAAWEAVCADPRFDLLCLDVRMPAPDGITLAQQIRATPEYEQLPIVLITSAADKETVLSATRAQVQGFIVKPVGDETVGRLQRLVAAFDASVLEPARTAMQRLGVDPDRYAKYVDALVLQLRGLVAGAQGLGQGGDVAAFQHKCGVCRNGAAALGARRVEQLLADAGREAASHPERSAVMVLLASYWLERVLAERGRVA